MFQSSLKKEITKQPLNNSFEELENCNLWNICGIKLHVVPYIRMFSFRYAVTLVNRVWGVMFNFRKVQFKKKKLWSKERLTLFKILIIAHSSYRNL